MVKTVVNQTENDIYPKRSQRVSLKPILLLVDDEPSFHQLFASNFEAWKVKSTYNSYQALHLIAQQKVDLAVVDLSFDNGQTYGGLDLIGQLHDRFPKLPIVAISKFIKVSSGDKLSDLAIQAGATIFLSKANYSVTEWQSVLEKSILKTA